MKKTYKKLTVDEIAEMADRGEDISQHFTNKGKIKYPVQRVNVDFTVEMLAELDKAASELNISRQALIKTYLRQALDQHYLAKNKVT
jgi:hypothetical protein